MGPFGMEWTPDYPAAFAGFNFQNVDGNFGNSVKEKMSDMNHFPMEPKHDSFLGIGMENMEISSKWEDYYHGFDVNFLPDYRGLDSCTTQDGEAGYKLEILDGFLDKVEDIYASHDLSYVASHSLPETEVKKKVSKLDGDACGLLNFSSDSYSTGTSGSNELSEWSKDIISHAESNNVSGEVGRESLDSPSNDMLGLYESEDDSKPVSTFRASWVGHGKSRNKNLATTSCSRLDSFDEPTSPVSYDFRPRRGTLREKNHTRTVYTSSDDDQQTSSESEDEVSVRTIRKIRSDRRKNQRMWTVDEMVKLMDGISHFGVGKWTDIKNLFFQAESHRIPIDMRDKWRNLLKASCTNKHNDGEAEEKRRSTRSIPNDILHRVRELASIHPYSHSKSPSFVPDSSTSRSTSRKKKKKSS